MFNKKYEYFKTAIMFYIIYNNLRITDSPGWGKKSAIALVTWPQFSVTRKWIHGLKFFFFRRILRHIDIQRNNGIFVIVLYPTILLWHKPLSLSLSINPQSVVESWLKTQRTRAWRVPLWYLSIGWIEHVVEDLCFIILCVCCAKFFEPPFVSI